jgi:hypothetical protein
LAAKLCRFIRWRPSYDSGGRITAARRRGIWLGPSTHFRKKISKRFVDHLLLQAVDEKNLKDELFYICGVMEAAEAAAQFVVTEITKRDYRGTREYEFWMLFVASIVRLLREYKIQVVKETKTDFVLSKHFVQFVEKLISFLPKHAQRRPDHHSLLKGLENTRDLLGDCDFDTSFGILVSEGVLGIPAVADFVAMSRSLRFGAAIAKAKLKKAAKARRSSSRKAKHQK